MNISLGLVCFFFKQPCNQLCKQLLIFPSDRIRHSGWHVLTIHVFCNRSWYGSNGFHL